MTTNRSGSRVSVLTVAQLLGFTAIGNGQHLWPAMVEIDA